MDVVPHCSFHFHFSNKCWWRASFHGFIDHLCIFLGYVYDSLDSNTLPPLNSNLTFCLFISIPLHIWIQFPYFKYLFPLGKILFIFLLMAFETQFCFYFDAVQFTLHFPSFLGHAVGITSKRLLPNSGSQRFTSEYFSKRCISSVAELCDLRTFMLCCEHLCYDMKCGEGESFYIFYDPYTKYFKDLKNCNSKWL